MNATPDAPERAAALQRLGRLAWWLDSSIRLPGGWRIGMEGLLGLVPMVGDAAGALLSSYIVVQGARLGVPATTLMRMLLNVGLEVFIGAVPVLGDLFDFVFKANLRNVRLIEQHVGRSTDIASHSRWRVGGVLLALAAMLLLLFVLLGLALLAGLNALFRAA